MGWDPIWETIFRERTSWGKYPPEELIRFIAQNYYQVENRKDIRILEIGCGPGGGPSWFVAREGFSFFGIDGSQTAIDKAIERFNANGLNGEFICGPINDLPWRSETFDCVIDVACLQHNNEADTKEIVRELYRVLKKGGRHFSLTSKNDCWGDHTGTRIDGTSWLNVTIGPFSGMGTVRFATRESLVDLYREFRELNLEYSIRSVNGCQNNISNWILTCTK